MKVVTRFKLEGKVYEIDSVVTEKDFTGSNFKLACSKGWIVGEGQYTSVDKAKKISEEQEKQKKEKELGLLKASGAFGVLEALEKRVSALEGVLEKKHTSALEKGVSGAEPAEDKGETDKKKDRKQA